LPFGGTTIGGAIAIALSALLGGILSTIALYFMDKIRNQNKQDKLQIQLITQSGVVVQYKTAQSFFVLGKAYEELQKDIDRGNKIIQNTNELLEYCQANSKEELDNWNDLASRRERLKQLRGV